MSLLQIDTINVVARAALIWCCLAASATIRSAGWTRRRAGELMEYWAHEACFAAQRFCTGASPHADAG
jgi:uncharacterized protein YcaQ